MMSWYESFLKILALSVAIAALTGLNAQAQAVKDSTDYEIIVQHSGKCLDLPGSGTAPTLQVVQYDCIRHGRFWNFQEVGGGYYQIIAKHSGLCMYAAAFDGALIRQGTCSASTNQHWTLKKAGEGYKIKAKHSGKCMQVVPLKGNGKHALQRECDGEDNQLFKLVGTKVAAN